MTLIDVKRIERVIKFDNAVFKEIRDDEKALTESFVTILLSSIIGSLWQLLALIPLMMSVGYNLVLFLVIGILIVLIAMPIALSLSTLIVWVPARLLGGKSSFIGNLKVLAYASAPQSLGIIPIIGPIVGGIWSFICEIVAVREAHEISTGKAILALLIILLVGAIILLILLMLGVAR
jgi:hypothetical protein